MNGFMGLRRLKMKPVIKEGQYEYNLDEIAEMLKISRSAASEAQRSALRKLRVALEKRGYNADDFLEKNNDTKL
jgi:DNA-directed RNA polymerase specialized sigma24 family protein